MKDKTIVLADSSYTIRRIVELSFSEIEEIEIISFENGQELKNRLLEIHPRVVIVDVKLPGISGYEICQLINQTEALKKTRVFLMKGSFEPINQEWIKNLKFEEIITKPFDSNLLVAAVMKIMEEKEEAKARPGFTETVPASMPEDFASIDTSAAVEDELNFSDIRDEILTAGPKAAAQKKPAPEEEEIQPSEEITQAQTQKDDALAPKGDESVANPFDSEAPAPGPEAAAASAAAAPKPPSDQSGGKPPQVERFGDYAKPESEQEFDIVAEPKEISDIKYTGMANEETSEATRQLPLEAEAASAQEEEGHFPGDLLEPPQMNIELTDEPPVAPIPEASKPSSSGISAIFGDGQQELRVESDQSEGEFFPLEGDTSKELVISEVSPPPPPARPAKAPSVTEHTAPSAAPLDKSEIEKKLFEQLSGTIREALWEIIPPLAEKIIREEIERIKSEAPKSEV